MTRIVGLILSLAPLAACAPDHIARATCRSEMLAIGDPWKCTVRGDRVEQASSIDFSTESRNHVARVKLALSVTRGTLRVRYADLTDSKWLTITPETPALVEMETRLRREGRSFTLHFEPRGGPVEGLRGTVDYSTP